MPYRRSAVPPFRAVLTRFDVGVVQGVVPPTDSAAWIAETHTYLKSKHNIRQPPSQDLTCFDFFWLSAQVRSRAHLHMLCVMRFPMSFWKGSDNDRHMAIHCPVSYAGHIRIHIGSSGGAGNTGSNLAPDSPAHSAGGPIIAQVDGGSLKRWDPDGYGRGGTYDAIFRGDWEAYDPWDPAGRISATPDLYNGTYEIFIYEGAFSADQGPVEPRCARRHACPWRCPCLHDWRYHLRHRQL